ncbi:proline--tRNA ligase [Patescibacteria group bacterium]
MRYSQLLGKTVKDKPKDAHLSSHGLLFQGGFIRRISTGRWAFLPLGMRVWEKIYQVIDSQMRSIGCQKLVVPTLQPLEIWQKTARDQAFGEEMMILDDHHGASFTLGATAEGVMVELVKMFSPSYKELPLEIYQFSSKFRDDKRPRGAIMRVREFMMKDAYNFCADEDQFMKSYQKFYDSYLKIAKELDLPVVPAEADSGAIGGSLSHEFLFESASGDQAFFTCDACGYTANIEKAEFKRKAQNPDEKPKSFKIIDQPEWVKTMDDNVEHYKEPKWRYLKNVVYKDAKGKLYIASVRGDQEVNEIKFKRAAGVDNLEPASDKDLKKMGTRPGYVHSWGIKGVTFIGDLGLEMVKNFIGGYKEEKTDSFNVNYGRDFKYDLLADIVDARDGDQCGQCQKGKLIKKKGFEWGHTFKIDHFYTGPQEGLFVDQDGRKKPLWMGSYGIGLGRTMACLAESHHDEDGLIWPESVAPFQVHLLAVESQKPEVRKLAKSVYEMLVSKGIEVLWDDRTEVSAGVKFKDADLIGCPVRLVVSQKLTKDGKIELKNRKQKKVEKMSLNQVFKKLKD